MPSVALLPGPRLVASARTSNADCFSPEKAAAPFEHELFHTARLLPHLHTDRGTDTGSQRAVQLRDFLHASLSHPVRSPAFA